MPALKRGSRRGTGVRAGVTRRSRRRPTTPVRRARPRPVPRAAVLARPDLLGAIASATAAAGELETGGPLIGTVQRSWGNEGRQPDLIVSLLGTVAPGPGLRATGGSVALGRAADGERAASAIRWWRRVTGLDLVHLGDWHKHDSSSPEPSPGDRATAREMRAEAAGPIWLAAIAVGKRSKKLDAGADGNRARVVRSATDCEHVRFYRAIAGVGLKPVPVHVEAHALPGLPTLPWHVADPARFAAECRLLAAAGFTVAVEPSDSPTRPGLALSLRRDGKSELTVVTPPDYPVRPPVVRGKRGRRAKATVPWSAGRFLVDLVRENR